MSLGVASVGSTLKDSEMQVQATSMESRSSSVRVPSVREVVRKSIIERARRCFVVAMVVGCRTPCGVSERMGCGWNEWIEGKYVVVCDYGECRRKEGAGKRTDASWGFR